MPHHLRGRADRKTGRVTWHYQRRVPLKLVSAIGFTFWREDLRTSDRKLAERRASVANAKAEKQIAAAEAEISQLAELAETESLRQRRIKMFLTADDREILEEVGGLDGLRKLTINAIQQQPYLAAAAEAYKSVLDEPRELLAKEALDPDQQHHVFRHTQTDLSILAEQISRNTSILARATGVAEEEIQAETQAATHVEKAPTQDLNFILNRYATTNDAPASTVSIYRTVVRRFNEAHGPIAVQKITRTHIREFLDLAKCLPNSRAKVILTSPIRSAIKIAAESKIKLISQNTVNQYKAVLSGLLNYARDEGFIESAPTTGLGRNRRKGNEEGISLRDSFTPAEMRSIRSAMLEKVPALASAKISKWPFLIASYEGMRLEEIAQLKKKNVIKDPKTGVWSITITDKDPDQHIKNRQSRRTIPVHPKLIEAGFLAFIGALAGDSLFPDMKPDKNGRRSSPYSRQFARMLDGIGLTNPRVTFHSLRHTFKDAARNALCPDQISSAILGHSYGSKTGQQYGTGVSTQVMAGWLAKIDPFADV